MSEFVEIIKEKLEENPFFPVLYYLIEPPKKAENKRKVFIAETECDFYNTKRMLCQSYHKHVTKTF